MKEKYELVSGIFNNNKAIKGLEKQYDKLCEKVHSSEIVQGVSLAVACVSALGLAGASDVASIEGASTASNPSTWIIGGVCALGFAVSYFSNIVKNYQQGKADEIAGEIQDLMAQKEASIQELNGKEIIEVANKAFEGVQNEQNQGGDADINPIVEAIRANHAMHTNQDPHENPQNDDSLQNE